jgi:hypothetical protein
MASIGWTLSVQVVGSPPLSVASAPVQAEAIDRVEVNIAPGDTDKVLDIQPGGVNAVRLLLVKSSDYGEHLSFKASDGATDSGKVVLDGPQLFSGGGVALLSVAPKQLKFTNTSGDKPANVEIHVARDATP